MVAIPILEESQQLETDILNRKCEKLVAHTGFGPVISSLRGRCPRPLDECAVYYYGLCKLKGQVCFAVVL